MDFIRDKKSVSIRKSFSSEEVLAFANISGDMNPVHIDEEYASKTIFKKRIVHGILVSGLFSALIANELPGPGSIYLHQSLDFKKPVFHNQMITAFVEIITIRKDKPIFELRTFCISDNQELLIDGKAIVIKK